jgi:glycosyltransferase involved in cell wall biosynthesis
VTSRSRKLTVAVTSAITLRVFVSPQIPYLVDAGWSVTVVSSSNRDDAHGAGLYEMPGVELHQIPMVRAPHPRADAVALTAWLRFLAKVKPNVILGSTPKAGLLSMVAGRMAGVPQRVFLHRGARWETESGWRRRMLMESDRLTMRSATHNLAVSRSLAELVWSQGLVNIKPRVLGSGGSKGVDRRRFKPASQRTGGGPYLGFLGRLSPDKDLDAVLDVFAAVKRTHPQAVLRIGGAVDADHPLGAATLSRIRSTPGVEELGAVRDAPEFLQSLDLLIFPSRREGLPNVVIEAAACGVPTVGWDVTGVRDAINQGVTGAVVPRGDVTGLSRVTIDWLVRDSSVREECRNWSAGFDQQFLAEQLVEYLDALSRD